MQNSVLDAKHFHDEEAAFCIISIRNYVNLSL